MTKLEELKAAYEAATKGEWVVKQEREYKACNSRVLCEEGYTVAQGYSSGTTKKTYNELWKEAEGNTNFIALAHNLMPTLLEAVEVIQEIERGWPDEDEASENNSRWQIAHGFLEKLK